MSCNCQSIKIHVKELQTDYDILFKNGYFKESRKIYQEIKKHQSNNYKGKMK